MTVSAFLYLQQLLKKLAEERTMHEVTLSEVSTVNIRNGISIVKPIQVLVFTLTIKNIIIILYFCRIFLEWRVDMNSIQQTTSHFRLVV